MSSVTTGTVFVLGQKGAVARANGLVAGLSETFTRVVPTHDSAAVFKSLYQMDALVVCQSGNDDLLEVVRRVLNTLPGFPVFVIGNHRSKGLPTGVTFFNSRCGVGSFLATVRGRLLPFASMSPGFDGELAYDGQ